MYNTQMRLFDGKAEAVKIEESLREIINSNQVLFQKHELAIIQIGDNKSSEKYIQLKLRVCEKLGIRSHVYNISADLGKSEMEELVKRITLDPKNTGVIIQLPLPRLELNDLLNFIPIEKDIDILSDKAQKMFYSGESKKLSPVIRSIEHFLNSTGIKYKQRKVIIIGGGFLVGKPASHYFRTRGLEVEIYEDYRTGEDLKADLIILSAGVPNLVKGENILPGVSVVDFGSSVVVGKTVGDLDMSTNIEHLNWVSPSPGGMGPIVVRYLIGNFIEGTLEIYRY